MSIYKEIDDHPDGVIVVQAYDNNEEVGMGIFSNEENANKWLNSLPEHYVCVVMPYVIDEPDYGNVEKVNIN